MAMTMGATPASQIAQRFANALIQQVCIAMDALEKEARVTSPLAHEVQAALEMRDLHIDADSYSTQGRLYDCLMYSDDAHALAVGVPRAIRFLRAFWSIAGPSGLNTPLSRASKQQIGVCVRWLGGTLAAGLGLVWIPREKVARAASPPSVRVRLSTARGCGSLPPPPHKRPRLNSAGDTVLSHKQDC